MQRVIILRGTPASGKSTIAKSYRNFEEKIAWLKVDNFKDFFADDASLALDYVNGAAIATLNYLITQGFSVVMEGIFQNTSAIDYAISIANKHNVSVKVFELDVSLETLIQRDKVREGILESHRKSLSEEVITRIYNILHNNPYNGAVKLDTEYYSIEECKKIIDSSFT